MQADAKHKGNSGLTIKMLVCLCFWIRPIDDAPLRPV